MSVSQEGHCIKGRKKQILITGILLVQKDSGTRVVIAGDL
jgi:hypothetical protein